MRDIDFQLALEEAHRHAVMEGWDFARLNGRLDADDTPWDFERDCLTALKTLIPGGVSSFSGEAEDTPTALPTVADLGTGGGERLIRLVENLTERERSALAITATEGWEPNVRVARDNLRPYGVPVYFYDAEERDRMPYEDASQHLVMARHEAIEAHEIARALAPCGRFLTQQVAGNDAPQLREWFGGEEQYPHVNLGTFLVELEDQGLRVEVAEDWEGTMRFVNVQALVEYIGLVPWDLPEFAVADHIDVLRELDEHRPIEVTQRRFRIYARKV